MSCRKIVQFLTLDGRFSIKKNIKLLFHDIIRSFPELFVSNFDTMMEKIVLPSGLENLTFGRDFNQSMEKVALPSVLQNLTFGDDFN